MADDVPAVTATPLDRDAPNGGEWFTVVADPGETVTIPVDVTNSADTPQAVSLYLADLIVDAGGVAVGGRGIGVGGWGGFDDPQRTLAAGALDRATLRVTVPLDAEPGDHLGAVVAESQPQATDAGVKVVKRVAARLYVTVPGEADPGVTVDSIRTHADNSVLPRSLSVTFLVRNTGNVRLRPTVTVNGRRVHGPKIIVSKSAERYEARLPLSIWGGRTTVAVRVLTRTDSGAGPSANASTHVTFVPWWTLLLLFLLVVGGFAVRELRRRLR